MSTSRHLYINIMMKYDKWLNVESVCLASGHAVARNQMFENAKDQKLFIELWKKYLGGMTEIINYHLNQTSWTILFKTKTTTEIKKAYFDQRKKSTKAKASHQLKCESRMLSEHFRIFLSQFVRRTNTQHGRKGTLVLERFKKYVFKKYTEYEQAFNRIVEGFMEPPQKLEKYRVSKMGKKINSVKEKIKIGRVGNMVELWRYLGGDMGDFNSVLRKFFNPTKITPKTQNSS